VVLLVGLNSFGADKLGRSAVVGSIVGTQGTVQVDQHSVLPNEAVFAGDSISTGATSGAFLNLHGTIAILVEKSELALARSGDSVTMTLKKGALEIRNGQAQPAEVHVPGASVLVGSEGAFPSICRIASADQAAVVYAEKGHVEIHGAGAPTLVRPGQSVRLEAGVPQAAGQQAGKVSGHIPTGKVQHEGKGTLITLKLSDPIFWEDLVSTQDNGRIRIALEGGSYLNVGARSQMRIIQHDAQSQQTEVELKLGSLRGEVVKLTKGGKFETRTPTAVIGVVGTIYVVNANPQLTRVWSATGDVTVRNIDPNVPGEVTLHAGQTTSVQKGKPPESPSTAPANEVQIQMAQTNVPEGALAGATAGGEAASSGTAGGTAGGGTAGGFPGGVTNMVTIGAAGGSVIAGGVALHKMTQANNSVAAAQSALAGAANAASQAAASAAAAQQAAAAALAAAQEANNIATVTANQINSILKGCGCVSPQSMLSAAQQATAAAQQAHNIATATANPNGSGSVSPTKP
jgi:hypothetical protein